MAQPITKPWKQPYNQGKTMYLEVFSQPKKIIEITCTTNEELDNCIVCLRQNFIAAFPPIDFGSNKVRFHGTLEEIKEFLQTRGFKINA
jgi:hypothetical protein